MVTSTAFIVVVVILALLVRRKIQKQNQVRPMTPQNASETDLQSSGNKQAGSPHDGSNTNVQTSKSPVHPLSPLDSTNPEINPADSVVKELPYSTELAHPSQ